MFQEFCEEAVAPIYLLAEEEGLSRIKFCCCEREPQQGGNLRSRQGRGGG